MSPTIQLGLLGCGKMGQTLAQAVSATGLGSIRAVFDIDHAKSQLMVQTFGVEAAASEEELLARAEIQAVMIALPPYLHFPATLKVVQAGKHLFLEKPMALETAACRQMNEAVRDAGLSLMVGHVLRYFEPFRSITRWAREGRLGKPLDGAIWRCEAGFIRLSPWKAKRDLSGGYLFEIGAHELDWMRCLFGEAETIRAFTHKKQPSDHEIEDLVFVEILFSSGVFGSYLGGAGFPCLDYGFCLRFERATLHSRDAFNPQALRIDPVEGANPGILEISEGKEDPFMLEVRDWLECLIQGRPVPISGEEAEKTVALVEAAYQSAGQARLPEVVGHFDGEKKSER